MAYTTLVAPELPLGMIQAGETFLRALDAGDVPVTAAFWLLGGDEVGWRLVIASPAVDALGKKSFYQQLAERLTALQELNLSMSYIVAVSPTDPIVARLRGAIQTGPGIAGIRFTGNVVSGVLIPDAHIYRLT